MRGVTIQLNLGVMPAKVGIQYSQKRPIREIVPRPSFGGYWITRFRG